MGKGNTAMILAALIQGMTDAGCEVELLYASQLKVKPCSCGRLYCWNEKPGECCIQDDMQQVYPRLKEADTLILATPVYIPLPGDMQNFINRLVCFLDPVLEFHEGRTRAKFRKDVRIQRFVLVSTGGWWEIENFGTVTRIVAELARDASVEFAGAVLRPHVGMMKERGELTAEGQAVLQAARRAGHELVTEGVISKDTLAEISHPLISQEEYWNRE